MKYAVALLLSSAAALRFEENTLIQDNEQVQQAPVAEVSAETAEEPTQETEVLAQAENQEDGEESEAESDDEADEDDAEDNDEVAEDDEAEDDDEESEDEA